MTITEFLLARIAEDEAVTYRLVPYPCKPGCCAPAGWVGRECLICEVGYVIYGGSVEAITDIAEEHAEQVHLRSRLLAECKAKRAIVDRVGAVRAGVPCEPLARGVMSLLATVYADHPEYQQEWAWRGSTQG